MIFTNSLSALQSLKSNKISIKLSKYTLQIKEKYNKALEANPHMKIEFIWIPSFIKINGIESVYTLAKDAAKNSVLTNLSIPFPDFCHEHKKTAKMENNRIIVDQSMFKGKKYFQIFHNDDSSPWFMNHKLARDIIVFINRCRSDHYNLAASLSKIGIKSSPICECNKAEQDLNHIIWQCEIYEVQREKLMKKLRLHNAQLPLNIECLVAKPNVMLCKYVFEFFKDCGKII